MEHVPRVQTSAGNNLNFNRSRFCSSRSTLFAWTLVGLIIAGILLPIAVLNTPTGSSILNAFGFNPLSSYVEATIDISRSSDDTRVILVDDPPPCQGPVCLDEGIGARLIHEEIYHLKNILDLVDGFGRPMGQIFDWNFRLIRSVRPTHGAIPDMLRLKFKRNLVDLLRRNRVVDQELLLTGLVILGNPIFRFPSSSLSQLRVASSLLDYTHSLHTDDVGRQALQSIRWRYIQEVDSFVAGTVHNFTAKILRGLEDVLPDLQVASTKAETARTLAISLLPELDDEKTRVAQTLLDLPWWDRFTFAHFVKQSRTSYFREYQKFFDENEPIIRFYAESVQIVADNLLILIDYAHWYRRRQSNPIDARHIPATLSSEEEMQKLKEAIEDYTVLAETRFNDYRAASTPPHRLIRDGVPFTLPVSS